MSQSMFPLNCARVREHTSRETSTTRKLGAHIKVPSKSVFAYISYMSFQIQISPGKILPKRNFIHTHRLLKISGNISHNFLRLKLLARANNSPGTNLNAKSLHVGLA